MSATHPLQSLDSATLQSMLLGTGSTLGSNFLQATVRELAELFSVKLVFVADRSDDNHSQANALCTWFNGQIADNFSYDVDGTPCELVEHQDVVYIPVNVETRFPNELGFQGYLGVPLRDANNSFLGHFCMLHDEPLVIDHEKIAALQIFSARVCAELARLQADRRQAEATRAIEKANKAKTDFLTNMSHELRTPLNGVLGFTQILLETTLQNEQRELTEGIRTAANQLLWSVDHVLDFCKLEAGELHVELTDNKMSDIITAALGRAEQASSAYLTRISTYIDASLPEFIRIDAVHVGEILDALLDNAIRFAPGGKVEIRITHQNSTLRCEIIDDGIGISADKIEEIFEPFTQADNSTTRDFGGVGLGLSIARRMIKLLGGDIGCDSVVNEGSRFWFTLQFEPGQNPVKSRQTLDLPTLRPVLVVDDNVVNQRVLAKMLERLGFKYQVVENGQLAVEAFAKTAFAAILMDCQMPVMDGYTAAQTIREAERGLATRIPIIAVTAHAMEGDRQRCLDAGMDDYLKKPVSIDILGKTLAQWLTPATEAA